MMLATPLFAAASLLAAPGSEYCGYDTFYAQPAKVRLARVTSAIGPRVHFYRGDQRCGPGMKGCRISSYVIPRDTVAVSHSYNGFVCANYTPERPGPIGIVAWLPAKALEPVPIRPQPLNSWSGDWVANWAHLKIEVVGAGRLQVEGRAMWSPTPWKISDSYLHTGELEGRLFLEGRRAHAVWEGDRTLPYDPDRDGCGLEVWRLNEFLLATDNWNCGGVNVSFQGLYRRPKGRLPDGQFWETP
jgi:hypothetical protein